MNPTLLVCSTLKRHDPNIGAARLRGSNANVARQFGQDDAKNGEFGEGHLTSYPFWCKLNIMATGREIVARIHAELNRSDRSLREISIAAHVPYQVVYRIAHKQRGGMTVETAAKLAKALGLTLDLTPAGRKR